MLYFLSKTKLFEDKSKKKKIEKIGVSNYLLSIERSGSFWLLWDNFVCCKVFQSSNKLIIAESLNFINLQKWGLMGIYGCLRKNDKSKIWVKIKQFLNLYTHHWCSIGDFNTILNPTKKRDYFFQIKHTGSSETWSITMLLLI